MIPVTFRKHPNTYNYIFPKFVTTNSSKTYEILEQLTQGGNSVILKVRYKDEDYALKCDVLDIGLAEEIKILKTLSEHDGKQYFISYIDEGILKTKEKRHPKTGRITSPSGLYSYYIMDLATQSFNDYMCKQKNKTFEVLYPQVKQLITGLKIIHEQGKLHRDIKPDNILMQNNALKIADFGLAVSSVIQCTTKQGPKYWPTPEYLGFCKDENFCAEPATDVFQLGCIIFYLFTGKYPIGNASIDLIDENNPIKNLLIGMLEYDNKVRLNNGITVWNELGKIIVA